VLTKNWGATPGKELHGNREIAAGWAVGAWAPREWRQTFPIVLQHKTKYKHSNVAFAVTSIELSWGHLGARLLELTAQSLIGSPGTLALWTSTLWTVPVVVWCIKIKDKTHLGEVALFLLYLLQFSPCLCAMNKCVNHQCAQVAITHAPLPTKIGNLVTYIYVPRQFLVTTCPHKLLKNDPKTTKIGRWGHRMVQISTPPEAIVSWARGKGL